VEQYERCRKEFDQYKAQLASEKEMLQNSAFKRVELDNIRKKLYDIIHIIRTLLM